jgi:hypothetical protein
MTTSETKRALPSNLYRIIKFERLLQLFERRELYFSHPSRWEDPYETRLCHRAFNSVAAQCWCKHSVSDAMWRIYSPNQLGVRIKTTRAILTNQLRSAISGMGRFSWKVADVSYKPQSEIDKGLASLVRRLKPGDKQTKALVPLFWKRRAFVHEAEVRAVVYDRQARTPISEARIRVDPHALIQSILVDPRAPDEIVEMYKYFLKTKVMYQGRIAKSELYAKASS